MEEGEPYNSTVLFIGYFVICLHYSFFGELYEVPLSGSFPLDGGRPAGAHFLSLC